MIIITVSISLHNLSLSLCESHCNHVCFNDIECTSSNGSSSMASVCAGSLALYDAGKMIIIMNIYIIADNYEHIVDDS